MPELVTRSVAQEQQERKVEKRSTVKRAAGFTTAAAAVAVLAVLGVAPLFAQAQNKDKYSLKSPSGIAFSDFRGYEDWARVSSARTTETSSPTFSSVYSGMSTTPKLRGTLYAK